MLIVSIGLIKERLKNAKIIVREILKGDLVPNKIIFYVSKKPWALDEGIKPKELPKFKSNIVEFKYVPNICSLRRVQPIIKEYWEKKDTKILLIDDDMHVPKHLIREVNSYSDVFPNSAVGILGRIYPKKDWKSKIPIRGWQIKKPKKVDFIAGGWYQLIKPGFFHKDFLKWEDYKHLHVNFSDEIFIAYQMARKGTDRIVIPVSKRMRVFPRKHSLFKYAPCRRAKRDLQFPEFYNTITEYRK